MEAGTQSRKARTLWGLLTPQRNRLVPYSGIEVLAVVYLMTAVWPYAGYLAVTETGLGTYLYGRQAMMTLHAKEEPAVDSAREQVRLLRGRVSLPATLIVLPFQVLTAPLLLRRMSRTQLYQFGLTSHRWGQNVLLGLLGCVVLTPLVLGLNEAVTEVFRRLTPDKVTEHSFARLSRTATGVELALIVFLAMVAAPAVEEILFRGVLQTWLTRHEGGAHVVMLLTFLVAVPVQPETWGQVFQGDWLLLAPMLFVLLMGPGYVWVWRRQRTPVGTALYATSMLFGMFHQTVWPSPIALFVLALGWGWLARRTGSLIGPIVLHSLLKGVACVQMLMARCGTLLAACGFAILCKAASGKKGASRRCGPALTRILGAIT